MSRRPLASLDVAVLGLGAVGTALARSLSSARSSRSLSLHSRRPGVAALLALELARDRGAPTVIAHDDLSACLRSVDAAILCVRDDELQDRAHEIARAADPRAGAVLLHTSGYHAVEILSAAASVGWSTGGLHPLISIPRARAGSGPADPPFADACFAIAGDPRALASARALAEALGGLPIELAGDPGARARYHAAAALLSNGLVALFDAADELLASALPATDAERGRALARLLHSTARGLGLHPAPELLTGPIARGDPRVVAGHLAALRDRPDLLALYRELSARMVELARRAGRVEPAILDELAALLSVADSQP